VSTTPRWPVGAPGSSLGERLAVAAIGVVIAAGVLLWLAGQLAAGAFGGGWPDVSPADMGGVLGRLPGHLDDPSQAWPARVRTGLPGPIAFYTTLLLLVLALAALVAVAIRLTDRQRGTRRSARRYGARWATARDVRDVRVRQSQPGRLTLGRVDGRLLAAEKRQSVVVVAPTQSLKTTGLAIPAILEWDGPVLATSVKTDLLADTIARRRTLGETFVYDPTGATGQPSAGWSPLIGATTWQGAQRVAASLCAAAQPGRSGLADADFWYSAAAKLLAPVLYAAASSRRSMADVVRWVDTQEREEVREALIAAENEAALVAAEATWNRDERQRSSIYTTTETVLAAYADPGVLASAETPAITADRLLDGGAHAVYLCAPAHEQQRLRPLFATLVADIVHAVYQRATTNGAPLDPPLLIVLDEAANIAPLADLDTLASTAAGQGIQLVSVFQDLAQIKDRWGTRAHSIVNNHRAKIIGSGVADPDTLDYAARILGDEEVRQVSATTGQEGHASTTQSTTYRSLAPAHVLRQARPGTGLLVYGHLPPARIELRPWFADRGLRALAHPKPTHARAA